MKIFEAKIEWVDEPGTTELVNICDIDQVLGEGTLYSDAMIFFYGLDGDELNRLVETQEVTDDFRVKEFWLVYEDNPSK